MVVTFVYFGFSQQDPMFTKYMFNSLSFNPAYAGSHDYMSVRLLYRDQWWGTPGAPTSQTFTVHSPVGKRVGLGVGLTNDKIGASGSTTANISYAYRIPFGKGKLNLGLQTGVTNWRADWSVLRYKDPRQQDQVFTNLTENRWLPNFGAGAFYYAPKFYVGFSVPHLINWDLQKTGALPLAGEPAQLYRHFFFHTGMIIPVKGDAIVFKPSLLIKSVGLLSDFSSSPTTNPVGAPTEFDIDLSLLFYDAFWVGVSFRSAFEARQFGGASSFDSADIWAAFYLFNGIRIGAAYDYTLTPIQEEADGSFEIMLGYDFNYTARKVNTPRYF